MNGARKARLERGRSSAAAWSATTPSRSSGSRPVATVSSRMSSALGYSLFNRVSALRTMSGPAGSCARTTTVPIFSRGSMARGCRGRLARPCL